MAKQSAEVSTFAQPLGRRARKALAVRQALFDAGLVAMDRQPIGLVSVLDITEAADVAKGVFYLQFKSKDDYLLALWEEVQNRFLECIRTAAIGAGSQSARIDAAALEFLSFRRKAPQEARFWVRMSSYFPDEIGEPGHLARIREEYLQQLAAVVAGKAVARLTPRDLRISEVIDTFCWAVVAAEVQRDEPLIPPVKLLAAIWGALPISRAR